MASDAGVPPALLRGFQIYAPHAGSDPEGGFSNPPPLKFQAPPARGERPDGVAVFDFVVDAANLPCIDLFTRIGLCGFVLFNSMREKAAEHPAGT